MLKTLKGTYKKRPIAFAMHSSAVKWENSASRFVQNTFCTNLEAKFSHMLAEECIAKAMVLVIIVVGPERTKRYTLKRLKSISFRSFKD